MTLRFIHTADIHLGKTYRNSPGEAQRYEDFFSTLSGIVANAIEEQVDFVLIAGDLFHTGQILPRTFARTIEVLAPLKESAIPCLAVEGNHDWIHRRDSISWMEALSQMGYIRLLRPGRTADGGYHFTRFDSTEGTGGFDEIGEWHIYGLGYIGTQAGAHVPRLCEAVTTTRNILMFHVGIWTYSPVEIGNMKPEEAEPLAQTFDYVALGHGHKPYIVKTKDDRPYAFNPGSPECTNFGEQKYDKGYYLCTFGDDGSMDHEFRPTSPRPMHVFAADLSGSGTAQEALDKLLSQTKERLANRSDSRRPLLEIKLTGQVGFHPFELSRELCRQALGDLFSPLHTEIKNNLSLVVQTGENESVQKSLADIEKEVLGELIDAGSDVKGQKDLLVELALTLREKVQKGENDGDELLDLLLKDA